MYNKSTCNFILSVECHVRSRVKREAGVRGISCSCSSGVAVAVAVTPELQLQQLKLQLCGTGDGLHEKRERTDSVAYYIRPAPCAPYTQYGLQVTGLHGSVNK